MTKGIVSQLLGLILAIAALSGCMPQGESPQDQREVARQGLYSARFSHDGSWLFVGSLHHGGSLWSSWPPERHFDWNHAEGAQTEILASAFSNDKRFVATASNRTIVLWIRQTGEAFSFWNAPGDILDIALTGTGRYAALAMQDYSATIFDIQNGGIYHRLQHQGTVFDVSIDGSDRLIASGSDDLTARVWQLESGKELLRLQHGNQVRTVELSRDGRWLFTSAMREPGVIWDSSSGRKLVEIAKPAGHYSAVKFSHDGRYLLTGSSDGLVAVWKTSDGSLVKQWKLGSTFSWNQPRVLVEDVAFAGSYYYAVTTDGQLFRMK
ncbi:WD40 repeat domain-containing protein [Oceanobacter kriegii]|uniref:WD40 repeat domain-containing protein n=1 Tax=Oceanobacter kriegii TaxID=64972 RepID=UPI000428B909|nr:hypothetical protein [Oceanobacter kriegii]